MNQSVNLFADSVTHHLLPLHSTGNFLVSPLSLMTALSMILAGAAGGTRASLASSLHISDSTSQDEVDSYFRKLLTSYNRRSGKISKLLMKNKVLVAQQTLKEAPILPTYKSKIEQVYQTTVEPVDFQNKGSNVKQLVNAWIDKATNGTIKEIISGIPSNNTIIMLLNTIFLNFVWRDEMHGYGSPYRFTTESGEEKKVPYMQQWGDFNYCEISIKMPGSHEVIKSVEIPYLNGSSMFLMLPPEGMQVNNFFQQKTMISMTRQVLKEGKSKFMQLVIPRFKFKVDLPMKYCVKSLGAGEIFYRPDFSLINGRKNLLVSDVKQVVAIDVDERGTRAAAETEIYLQTFINLKRPSDPPPLLIFDRPFAFVIYDTVNEIPIFIGRIADPSLVSQ